MSERTAARIDLLITRRDLDRIEDAIDQAIERANGIPTVEAENQSKALSALWDRLRANWWGVP